MTLDVGDGPDTWANYNLLKIGKKFDYFTSCLTNPQKGATAVSLPLGSVAPIKATGNSILVGGVVTGNRQLYMHNAEVYAGLDAAGGANEAMFFRNGVSGNFDSLQADLTNATAATINSLRESITLQQFLERDSRSGTRYQEIVKSHFAGVVIPDFRSQRSEIIHIFDFDVRINPVAQTNSAGGVPIGHLYDYFGVPTEAGGMGGAGAGAQRLMNMSGRAYNRVWSDHFRHQQL